MPAIQVRTVIFGVIHRNWKEAKQGEVLFERSPVITLREKIKKRHRILTKVYVSDQHTLVVEGATSVISRHMPEAYLDYKPEVGRIQKFELNSGRSCSTFVPSNIPGITFEVCWR